MTKVVVLDPDKEFYEELKEVMSSQYQFEISGNADRIEVFQLVLNEIKPTLVIVGPGWNRNQIEKMRKLLIDRDKFNLLLISRNVSSDLIQTAIEIKATDVLSLPLQKEQLLHSLVRAKNLFEAKVQSKDIKKHKTEIITVFGPKGGVGKSVIATNIASLLAKRVEKKTAILDADLQFGDVGVMLKLEPTTDIYQALSNPKLTLEKFKDYLVKHSSGFQALLAPIEPEIADLVKPEQLERIIKYLKRLADYIIIDTPPTFSDNVLSILDYTDWLFLVVTMDVPSLKNARLTLETLEMLNYDLKKVHLVVNRIAEGLGVTIEELEKALDKKIKFKIPEDIEVTRAVNEGKPVVLSNPKSPAAKSLEKIANSLLKDISLSEIEMNMSRRTA